MTSKTTHFCNALCVALSPFQSHRISRRCDHVARVALGKIRCAANVRKKGTKEWMRLASSTSSVSRNAQPRFATIEVHAWANSMLSIRYSRRGSRMGITSLSVFHLHALQSAWKSRKPPIFSYRILVCIHARRAINGKILESRSCNPNIRAAILPSFHGVGFTITMDWPICPSRARALCPPSIFSLLSLRFRSALFPARPLPFY